MSNNESFPEPDQEFDSHSDMQLHVHGGILNATFDTEKKRWTAVSARFPPSTKVNLALRLVITPLCAA